MSDYQPILRLGADDTPYRKLEGNFVSEVSFEGETLLKVDPQALTMLASEALRDVSHLLRPAHLASLADILQDPEASDNDRFVARELLKNATIAARGVLPSCQDTGTAIVMGKKGDKVWTGGGDEAALSAGIARSYADNNLRYSQLAPLSMFKEKNTGDNLPAQIDLLATEGAEYSFLFLAKGGGSANKTYLYQQTKSLLNDKALSDFIEAKLKTLGTAACPPYYLSLVIGGTSAEQNLKVVKLASTRYLDSLPTSGDESGRAFRDLEWESRVLELAQKSGIGAQFGGKYFAHLARVIRLPRHGASCPVGLGVSCSADRQIKAKINRHGVFLEELERHPERLWAEGEVAQKMVAIDLDQGLDALRAQLTKLSVGTGVLLSGSITVARDIAHARVAERLAAGESMPDYFSDSVIYYAGPAKTPEGLPSGSFGPTTAQRMDPYVPLFQAQGGSLVTLAKGNRSAEVTKACKENGGFYLGSIGGPAARLGQDCITKIEIIDMPELGMEAVHRISVKDFPAFIIVDDKGNDFFARLLA
ncbi:MAG: FumA C-terminus/TtdB family hydratase beta subunit [Myxococcota bacterium]|nr:FumA C-terminus/TtdB family hydratase beta subunit [Myxococcota bacterium]